MRLIGPDEPWDDDDFADFDIVAPELTLEVDGPEVLGVLLDHRGDIGWTLLDRPLIDFGFQPAPQED